MTPTTLTARNNPDRVLLTEVRASALLLGACFSLCGFTLAVEHLLAAFG